jgi:hypothetical protein
MEYIMKATIKILIGTLALTSCAAFADFNLNKLLDGDGLPTLTSSVKKRIGFTKAAVPYANSVEYFGYIDKNSKPDAKVNGKDAYYLYVWVPGALDELGVRMISPVGDLAKPEKDNFVQKGYAKKHQADSDKWFDTWLRVERMDVIDAAKIKGAKKSIQVLAKDDDGDDTYEEERHSKYNSLVRIKSKVSSPTKALVRGLYRIAFTTYKKGDVEGSFVATIGANVPGIKIATSLTKLHKMVN